MPELAVYKNGQHVVLPFTGSPLLYDVLAHNGFSLPRVCGGKGVCGKCRIKAEGALIPPPENGTVLACVTRLTGNALVMPEESLAIENIAEAGSLPPFARDPMPGAIGLAVDIGTTTLSAQVIDLASCAPLGGTSRENPQRAAASDVIGRMEYVMAGGGEIMQHMVWDAIGAMEREACAAAGQQGGADVSVITGNTTMLYLLTGRDPACLSRAPFEADHLFGEWMQDKSVYLPACASGFVGADITCAVLASGMRGRNETSLLIDIGTNGEIALWHKGRMYCCATAAGPAFEGGGISCGAGSVPGAIDTVTASSGALAYTTIGGRPARGICGSGLIDAMAALLTLGLVDETGAMDAETTAIAPDVSLTRKDVRMTQLAKGALSAGIKTLCETARVPYSDIAVLYIAGGFGSRLNLASAARIGLIPPELAAKARILGNAALTGAMMMLVNRGLLPEAKALAADARTVNLGACTGFEQNFMDCMMFPEA
jgi:uncharacterized 2Fe-2S/4Fe-4S cluster protein (DUF4445 family)